MQIIQNKDQEIDRLRSLLGVAAHLQEFLTSPGHAVHHCVSLLRSSLVKIVTKPEDDHDDDDTEQGEEAVSTSWTQIIVTTSCNIFSYFLPGGRRQSTSC